MSPYRSSLARYVADNPASPAELDEWARQAWHAQICIVRQK